MGMTDGGFTIEFDGKKNRIIRHGTVREYPIGAMACELARLKPFMIKDLLLEYDHLNDVLEQDAISDFILWLDRKAEDSFEPVIAGIIVCEFINYLCEIYQHTDEEVREQYDSMSAGMGENDSIKDFIFKDTPWSNFGRNILGQAVMTSYYCFAFSYVVARKTFDIFVEMETNKNQIDGLLSLFGENAEMQHIDFHIIGYDGGLHCVYTFNDAKSLILFEVANAINNEIQLVKCPNCGYYFVPEGRKDTLYCNYPSPQNPAKTCQDVGAQVARANKEKNDIGTKEYRKTYMRMKMAANRHPGNKKYYEPLQMLTEGNREWREKMSSGMVTMEDYLEWIRSFS